MEGVINNKSVQNQPCLEDIMGYIGIEWGIGGNLAIKHGDNGDQC
jgi:hypothetical protein